jgi:hypothetical protein
VWDRFLASDPGLLRLLSALSTVCAVLLTLGALAAVDASVPVLVAGALTAMVSTVAITERRPHDQALTLAAGVPVALVVVVIGSALTPYRVLADVVFVAVIFAALYIRRLGPRATTLGVFAFHLFFVTQFVGTRLAQLPHLVPTVLVAFTASALVRFALLRSPPERTLARLHRALRLRLALMLDALIEVAEGGPGTSRAARAADDLRRQAARLHAGALMIRSRLDPGTPDRGLAATVQRRVAEAETAAERLAVLVLRLVWPAADIDTLTRYLTPVHRTDSRLDVRVAVSLPALASTLRALRTAVRATGGPDGRTAPRRGPMTQRSATGCSATPTTSDCPTHPPRYRTPSAAPGTSRVPCPTCAWPSTRTPPRPRTPPRRRGRPRSRIRRTQVRRRMWYRGARPATFVPPPGPRSRWPPDRRWRSSVANCCRRSAGTGRCSRAGWCSSTPPPPATSSSGGTAGWSAP